MDKSFVNFLTSVIMAGLVLFGSSTNAQDAKKLTPEQTKFFETKIRPVLVRECYGCHAAKTGQAKGSLILDTKMGWEVGSSSRHLLKRLGCFFESMDGVKILSCDSGRGSYNLLRLFWTERGFRPAYMAFQSH